MVCACVHVLCVVYACIASISVCGGQRWWCLSSLMLYVLTFLRRGLSLNPEFTHLAKSASQWAPGTLLHPPPQSKDYKHLPPFLSFSVGAGDLNTGPHCWAVSIFTDWAISLAPCLSFWQKSLLCGPMKIATMLVDHKRKTQTQEDLAKEKQIKYVTQQWQGELCDPEAALGVSELLVRENIKVISINRDLPPPQGWSKTSEC